MPEVGKTSSIVRNDLTPDLKQAKNTSKPGEFGKALSQALTGPAALKFSSHAMDRLSSRGVNLSEQTVSRLNNAVMAAGKKGADQSLVLLDEMAFLVSVKNRTVITAMETNKMKEGVFTQIDSAVIG